MSDVDGEGFFFVLANASFQLYLITPPFMFLTNDRHTRVLQDPTNTSRAILTHQPTSDTNLPLSSGWRHCSA